METPDYNLHDDFAGRGDAFRIAYLIAAYLQGTILENEHDELDDWVAASDDNMRLFGELTDERHLAASAEQLKKLNPELAYEQLKIRLGLATPKSRFNSSLWIGIAASVALIISLLLVFTQPSKTTHKINDRPLTAPVAELPAGGAKATLTVGSQVINLVTVKEGKVLQGVQKKGALLTYNNDQEEPLLAMHALTTPVGGQYSVTLNDGTKVWLNAASSLRYPTSFTGDERVVQLTGEGYFEVATQTEGDHKRPFVVQVGDVQVKVTGTRFNVNAYANEPALTTSLLEGAVTVTSKTGESIVMAPGNQLTYSNAAFQLSNPNDLSQTSSWVSGVFSFHEANIETIMRQVERWYNATVIYKAKPPGLFNATIDRNVPLSKLLHYLELTGRVSFEVSGNNIYVKAPSP